MISHEGKSYIMTYRPRNAHLLSKQHLQVQNSLHLQSSVAEIAAAEDEFAYRYDKPGHFFHSSDYSTNLVSNRSNFAQTQSEAIATNAPGLLANEELNI
jgi:hypothetical protein